MAAEMLFRIDPDRNMKRFYLVDVQPTLFGEWELIREWGRIGQSGTVRHTAYSNVQAAEAALSERRLAKIKRGYRALAAA